MVSGKAPSQCPEMLCSGFLWSPRGTSPMAGVYCERGEGAGEEEDEEEEEQSDDEEERLSGDEIPQKCPS